MDESSRDRLARLGQGASIEAVCEEAKMTRGEFDAWWQEVIAATTPQTTGSKRIVTGDSAAGSGGTVQDITGQAGMKQGDIEIARDARGIPHIYAENDAALFFGFGWAMAQDRLWQLDYLRRRALGRLAEILGAEAVGLDVLARTVGLHRIAAAEVERLPAETLRLLEAFSQGINALMHDSRDRLPIEFALLDYEPEVWTPLDSVAIWGEFRWYLTGRLPVIAYPELARRTLNDEKLFQAFLTPESGDESIVPKGMYAAQRGEKVTVGAAVGDPQEGIGSNNWTVAGSRTHSGSPLLASDPHIAFGTVSCWYEVHLSGGSFNTVGMAYAGVPSVVMGRNEEVAWGITNNICSQRDLYLEQTDPEHPRSFLYDGKWEAARELTERIDVRGGESVVQPVQFSRNGPLVNHLLPEAARDFGPVSLRWLGVTFCDELTSMLQASRARSHDEFREALRGWRVPTWNVVFADKAGHIGYQAVGHVPVREQWERGFRPGWEPEQQWREVIPFDSMPALADPPSGWIRTANNRNAPEDFPYPLSGTWSSGHRAERIRQMLEEQPRFSFDDFRRMHHDVLALRAVVAVPRLLACLAHEQDPRLARAVQLLRQWDGRMQADQVAASIFEVFFRHWTHVVAAERFPDSVAPLMAGVVGGLALQLLDEDSAGWFVQADRVQKVVSAFKGALEELETRLGPDDSQWQWGNLHTITLRHTLSHRGALSQLLDRGGLPVSGSGFTVCNTGYVVTPAGYEAAAGANYRLIADFGHAQAGLWAVDAAGQSGHPGSPHYCNQLTEWLAGEYHFLPLARSHMQAKEVLRLEVGG